MKVIELTQGFKAIVDDDDYDYLMQWKWVMSAGYACRHERITDDRYARKKYKRIPMHKVINKTPDGMYTDHINGNRLDNRKENLRSCTQAENNRNRKAWKRSNSDIRYKGVTWYKYNEIYQATIRSGDKTIHLGYFTDIKQAARAYDKAAKELHGEFANLNNV